MEKISFVIPCYRSEKTIPIVVKEIVDTVTAHGGYDYEIILVNDSSPDNVMSSIEALCRENPKVLGVHLASNFGQHSAIMAGFHFVRGDIVVCLDDDGQTPANEMFRLIDKIGEYDLVFAEYKNKHHSGFRNFGSKVNDKMAQWLINKPKELKIMSYFACKRFVVDEVLRYRNPYPYISGLLIRTTNKVCNVEIDHRDRIEGESGYSLRKLLLTDRCCRLYLRPVHHHQQDRQSAGAAGLQLHHGCHALYRRHDHAPARHDRRVRRQDLHQHEQLAAVRYPQHRLLWR